MKSLKYLSTANFGLLLSTHQSLGATMKHQPDLSNGADNFYQSEALSQKKVKFMNFYPFNDLEMIAPRPLLFITGDQAHSKEFSEDAYQKASEPKELYYVKGAGHVDLYDRVNLIPFDKLETFFKSSLQK